MSHGVFGARPSYISDRTIESGMQSTLASGSIILLTRLAKVAHRHATDQVLGMSLKAYAALATLRDGPVSQHLFCASVHLDPNNCVLLLNALEGDGLAERRRNTDDRRRHIVELTPAGRAALERAERALETVEDEILRALTPAERSTLRQLLARAAAGTTEHPARSAAAAAKTDT